jgi:2-aminoadipate transaminase
MSYRFASRMEKTPRSFIREILKVTEDQKIISFAGGLPNPALFPVDEIIEAAREVLSEDGKSALQYSTTEGYLPLREFIAHRYLKRTVFRISPECVLITNGSQQCLDLIGKVFINREDPVAIEKPGYLGAIQAFSLYEPRFHAVPLLEDGPDTEVLSSVLPKASPKFFYGVPNFQNPSGISYSGKIREEVAAILSEHDTLFIEDDAYGELRFGGNDLPLVSSYLPDLGIITGSFSKIIAPGMRMGWIAAPPEVYTQLVTAKQASDLHSNYLTQRIICRYLENNDIDIHIRQIREVYRFQRDIMVKMIEETFPPEITITRPDGGMFLWATLPRGFSTMDLFRIAIKENVAFVPGEPFYTDGTGLNTMRLNYSNSDEERIVEGITRLSKAIHMMLDQ